MKGKIAIIAVAIALYAGLYIYFDRGENAPPEKPLIPQQVTSLPPVESTIANSVPTKTCLATNLRQAAQAKLDFDKSKQNLKQFLLNREIDMDALLRQANQGTPGTREALFSLVASCPPYVGRIEPPINEFMTSEKRIETCMKLPFEIRSKPVELLKSFSRSSDIYSNYLFVAYAPKFFTAAGVYDPGMEQKESVFKEAEELGVQMTLAGLVPA